MESKITRAYQITLPKEIREKLGLEIGDRVIVELENNKIVLIPKKVKKIKTVKLGKKIDWKDVERTIEKEAENLWKQ